MCKHEDLSLDLQPGGAIYVKPQIRGRRLANPESSLASRSSPKSENPDLLTDLASRE